ncbi:hypothetical protein CNR22_18310 [Sphingobacteriaceae bacterium]|nr:hypothetical protein CNR22_18310 [Sphingobacteriaceae bacterium]
MTITTLNTLLGNAPDLVNRLAAHKDRLQNEVHPQFIQLANGFQNNSIPYTNNPTLNQITNMLSTSDEQMNDDSEPITSILSSLADAANTLVVDTSASMNSALNTVNTLYNDAVNLYNDAAETHQIYNEITEIRQHFNIGTPGSQRRNFVTQFDAQLERDFTVVNFSESNASTYTARLLAVKTKLQELIASIAPKTAAQVNTLLVQAKTISDDMTPVISAMQTARTNLKTLGDGLVKGIINVTTDTLLNTVKTSINNLIAAAPSKSTSQDALLRQLKSAAVGFTSEASNPDLPTAKATATERRAEAKIINENARLLTIAYNELEAYSKQLEFRTGTAAEIAYYKDFRVTVDKFHIMAIYAESTGSKLASATSVFWNLFDFYSADPRLKVQLLNDNIPFALLPVRLETRFMTIKHVRDNISYSSYTSVIRTDADVQAIKTVTDSRTVTYSSPPVTGSTVPTATVSEAIADLHELWVRIYPDAISIHTHESKLTQTEKDDAQIYWNEVWKACGVKKFELGAWRVLCSSYGSKRAAWIVSQTNPGTTGKPADDPSLTDPSLTILNPFPTLPTIALQTASWSQKPETRVMPERFVVRVYSNNTYREVVGQPVPSPLPVGFDPMDPYTNYLDQNGSEINMPADLRWLTDFEEAEKIGMGIRITLQNNEKNDGFDRLLVLGTKLDLNATASKQELETLLDNHHYSAGLALVPQGTPTNNTEESKSGFASLEPGYEESFEIELGANQFTTTSTHYDKADGQRIAEALGVNTSVFQHIRNSKTKDVEEGMAMNRALWPATMGYYAKNMLTPSIVQSHIDDTRSFFTNYVLGRGLIPAFRVRNQPYGILTSTVYSKWKYSDKTIYEAKLHKGILERLRKYWIANFFVKVKHIQQGSANPGDLLINILGLHPSSLQFHQRTSIGAVLSSNMTKFMTAAGITQPLSPLSDVNASLQLDALYKSASLQSFSYFNIPRIFTMGFARSQWLLNGPVIDTLPLSEIRELEKLTNSTSNYIEWLVGSPIGNIRSENFTNVQNPVPSDFKAPRALLYLLLRHAWLLEYLKTAHCLLTTTGTITQDAWHNHEAAKMTAENGPSNATAEQKDMLLGFVRSEVQFENELVIEDTMRNLTTNTHYQQSGLNEAEYEIYLRDQSASSVASSTTSRYDQRLSEYTVNENQWAYVSAKYDTISRDVSVGDYIRSQINSTNPCYTDLRDTNNALIKLKNLPTARLERIFAESLDTCAYRLDSWFNGLVNKRLQEQRTATPNGIYLGAYGILERPKPGSFKGVHVVNISAADSWTGAVAKKGQRKILDLTEINGYPVNSGGAYVTAQATGTQPASFVYLGDDPNTLLIEDPDSGKIVSGQQYNTDNKGFILAPSLNHAVAAAVMRAGYAAHNSTVTNAKTMAVTLSSDRVRTAMFYIDGIRNGQNLAALLGYRFERGLHERQSSVTSLDGYIEDLRSLYSLVAGTLTQTPVGQNKDGQSRNVVDGLKLLEYYARTTTPFWYSGLSNPALIYNTTTSAYTTDGANIVKEIVKIKDDLDAIGDLLLSEAIFQITKGNHERAGSVLQALGYAKNIPEPEIIKTPRQADTFTHRCAVQFTPAIANTNWTASSTRATAEPALNIWLASQLPTPANIRINYKHGTNATMFNLTVANLNLQPIDLLYIFESSGENQSADSSELSRRIKAYVRSANTLTDDVEVKIFFMDETGFTADQCSIFQLTPMLKSLSRIIGNGRQLSPDDFLLPSVLSAMASPAGALDSVALKNRITTAKVTMSGLIGDLEAVYVSGQPTTTPTTKRDLVAAMVYAPAIPAGGATKLNNLRTVLVTASEFGVTTAYPEAFSSTTVETRDRLVEQADTAYKDLKKRYDEADTRLSAVTILVGQANTAAKHKVCVTELAEIAKLIFGRSFKVFTTFTLHNATEVQAASNYTTLLDDAGPFPIEAWMAGVARVRSRMGEYHKQMVIAESVRYSPASTSSFAFTKQNVFQFPVKDTTTGTDRWIGMKLPTGYEIPPDAISMIIESDGTSSAIPTCGMVIDEWAEQIPIDQVTSGIAINYDQPSSEAPQSIILAVTPEIKSSWAWNDLMDTLNETIQMAQIRAVEPDMIQDSPLSQVLPAIMAQISGGGSDVSPSLDFGKNGIDTSLGYDYPVDRNGSTQ